MRRQRSEAFCSSRQPRRKTVTKEGKCKVLERLTRLHRRLRIRWVCHSGLVPPAGRQSILEETLQLPKHYENEERMRRENPLQSAVGWSVSSSQAPCYTEQLNDDRKNYLKMQILLTLAIVPKAIPTLPSLSSVCGQLDR